MVAVIVPTANRPDMLRTALSSIGAQTGLAQIDRVIVSENGGSRESASICAEFPALPVTYVFRSPQLTPFEHGCVLFREARELASPYIATLHDDDWWGVGHIATALACLQGHPDAVAYWTACINVFSENAWAFEYRNTNVALVAGSAPITEVLKLDRKQAALACIPSSPGHYSSLVAEKDALVRAFAEVETARNPYDNDRLLFVELARQGVMLSNLAPNVFVRIHATRDSKSQELGKNEEVHFQRSTERILDYCISLGIDVGAEMEGWLARHPGNSRKHLLKRFFPSVIPTLKRRGVLPASLEYLFDRPNLATRIKSRILPWVPPATRNLCQKTKSYFTSNKHS